MPKSLPFVAVALIACASQQRTMPTDAGPNAEDRTTVVQPSSLAPEQVRLLQRSLIDRGFAVDLNGTFDQPTQTALAQFQRARGIPATGNLNAPTIDALGLDPRDVEPRREDPTATGLGAGGADDRPARPAPPRRP